MTLTENRISKSNFKEYLVNQYGAKLTEIGYADTNRFKNAPENYRPEDLLDGAKTVIVLAKKLPRGILHSQNSKQHLIFGSQHSIYNILNGIVMELVDSIEEIGYRAVPVFSYTPMKMEGYEAKGLLSLKHAAVNAGLGLIGKNGLVNNQQYGNLLRFAAVVTDMDLESSQLLKENTYCEENCNICSSVCPAKAISDSGLNKVGCFERSINHGSNVIMEQNFDKMEIFFNTSYQDYWIDCSECILKCPLNKKIG